MASTAFLLLTSAAACGGPEVEELAPAVGASEEALGGVAPVETWTIRLSPRDDEADVYSRVPPESLRERFRDRFPVVVFLQGGLVSKEFYSNLARRVAARDFVVVVPNRFNAFFPGAPPQLLTDQQVIVQALSAVEALDADPNSPLFKIADTTRSAVAGHSLGGVVGLFGIDGRCLPPLCMGDYVRPSSLRAGVFYGTNLDDNGMITDVDTSTVPTVLIQGLEDGVALPRDAERTFEEALDGTKVLITLEGANHFGLTDVNAVPGAVPDPQAQSLRQNRSIRIIARWTARALKALVVEEPVAQFRIFESGGTRDGRVTIRAERPEDQYP